ASCHVASRDVGDGYAMLDRAGAGSFRKGRRTSARDIYLDGPSRRGANGGFAQGIGADAELKPNKYCRLDWGSGRWLGPITIQHAMAATRPGTAALGEPGFEPWLKKAQKW